jgi:hypothetical protein
MSLLEKSDIFFSFVGQFLVVLVRFYKTMLEVLFDVLYYRKENVYCETVFYCEGVTQI